MIEINKPYKLGIKTLWLNILELGLPAMVVFIMFLFLLGCSFINPEYLFHFFHIQQNQYALITGLSRLGTLFTGAVFILLAAYAFIFSWLTYKNYTFTLGDHALEIQQGILSRKETSIPYRQIQDIDVSQSLFQRLIGVCRVVVLTAGHEDEDEEKDKRDHSEGIFILIDRQLAEEIHQELIKRSNVQEVVEFSGIKEATETFL